MSGDGQFRSDRFVNKRNCRIVSLTVIALSFAKLKTRSNSIYFFSKCNVIILFFRESIRCEMSFRIKDNFSEKISNWPKFCVNYHLLASIVLLIELLTDANECLMPENVAISMLKVTFDLLTQFNEY